jgi:hypothetical protein
MTEEEEEEEEVEEEEEEEGERRRGWNLDRERDGKEDECLWILSLFFSKLKLREDGWSETLQKNGKQPR